MKELITPKTERRFWNKVAVRQESACWLWTAAIANGYGVFSLKSRNAIAHRVAWVMMYGDIPEGLLVCHHCDNPSCCNPYHLFLGTQSDNMFDCSKKGRNPVWSHPEAYPRGERQWKAKLTDAQVLEIRALSQSVGTRELARRYSVSPPTISKILHRKMRKHI